METTFWSVQVAGNELWRIALMFGGILAGLLAGRLGRHWMELAGMRLRQRGQELQAIIVEALSRPLILVAFVLGVRFGVSFMVMDVELAAWVRTLANVLIVIAIGFGAARLVQVVNYWLRRMAEKSGSHLDAMLAPMVTTSLRVTIWVLVVLQVATILSDKPLTSILAGLGVGGLALALAAQDTVKNFFGSLVIFADKPFEVGERINVDAYDGTVEQVGFRSTRLRTLDGHLVTIPNGELANKSITNISKRPNIRRILNVSITYDTPPEKVQEAVEIMKEILKDHEGMNPDLPPRVVFNDMKSDCLNIFAIFWYHPADWWLYQAFNEKVLQEILQRYKAAGIDFAFPSQTMYLAGDAKRPLNLAGLRE